VAWSPDGALLAYQGYSSGGHQPYHEPVRVLDVERCEEIELQSLLDCLDGEGSWCATSAERGIAWSMEGKLLFAAVSGKTLDEDREFSYDPVTRMIAETRSPARPSLPSCPPAASR